MALAQCVEGDLLDHWWLGSSERRDRGIHRLRGMVGERRGWALRVMEAFYKEFFLSASCNKTIFSILCFK